MKAEKNKILLTTALREMFEETGLLLMESKINRKEDLRLICEMKESAE